MYCIKCGSPVGEGELFCSACGEKIDAPGALQNTEQPQDYAEQQSIQPQHGQTFYGQPDAAPKKPKAFVWALVGAAAVLAIAALLIFVVLPGGAQPTSGLLSGNTEQTQFVNESARFFENAFKGMGSDTFERLAKEPFDLSYDVTADFMGQKLLMSVDAAYDEKSFGLAADVLGSKVKVVLLDDIMYQATESAFGSFVTGVDYESEADLSKPMSLADRFTALGGNISSPDTETMDMLKEITELFVNSIDKGCFEKSAEKWTLKLDKDDLKDTLKTFAEKLEDDKELLSNAEDYLESTSMQTIDMLEGINTAVKALESDELQFQFACEIEYENAVPAGFAISYADGTTDLEVSLESGKAASGGYIDFDVYLNDVAAATGSLSYEKSAGGIEYDFTLNTEGETMKASGSEKWNGDSITGKITMDIPQAGSFTVDYEGTLKFGAVGSVKDDIRFEVDTENADITKLSESAVGGALGGSIPGLPFETD